MSNNGDREELIGIIRKLSYRKKEVVLASGRTSNFYFDMRKTALDARGGQLSGKLFLEIMEREGIIPDAVGGPETGAIAPSVHVQMAAFEKGHIVRAFYIRKAKKTHGLSLWFEGNVEDGNSIVIIEDVATTGGSAIQGINRIREELPNCKILATLVMVDRQEGAREAFEKEGISFHSIFTKSDFGEGD